MRKSLLSTLTAITVSALALSPVVVGATLLSADAAYAKSEKSRGGGRGSSKSTTQSQKGGKKSGGIVIASAPAVGNGQSWKTRIDGGALSLHPSEYGSWNSAKRNPHAIEQMVRKYEETGKTNGASGMIGFFVVAYNDYNEAQGAVYDAAQVLVDAETVDKDNAQAYLDGTLTEEAILAAIAALDEGNGDIELEVTDGTVSCSDGLFSSACDDAAEDIAAFQKQLDDYDTLENDADLQTALGELETAGETLDEAQGTVQPRTSTEESDADMMLGDVEQLLGVEVEELLLTDPPEEV